MSDSARERAVFCFTVYEKGDQDESRTILTKIVPVASSAMNFERFMAYIETPADSIARTKVVNDVRIGTQSGAIAYVKESEVSSLLGRKMADEDRARKQKDHQSYRPAQVLRINTCVIVIGSRAFCGAVANAHMVEIRELQKKLNHILSRLLKLPVYQRRATMSREDLMMVPVNQDPKQWITYNLCWWYEHLQRQSEIVGVIDFSESSQPRRVE